MFAQTMSIETRAELERIGALVSADTGDAVPGVVGHFLHMLILAGGYRRGLELGTGRGYSGLWIGSALLHNGGEFVTIDRDAAVAAEAQRVFARAGFGTAVTVISGEAEESLRELGGPFDFVFIDADMQHARGYFDLVWPMLAHHATIVTDHVVSHAQQLADLVGHLRRHPRLCSAPVPIGAGLEVSVKLREPDAFSSIDGADWVI